MSNCVRLPVLYVMDTPAICQWLNDTVGIQNWYIEDKEIDPITFEPRYVFKFMNEADATMFVLRWK